MFEHFRTLLRAQPIAGAESELLDSFHPTEPRRQIGTQQTRIIGSQQSGTFVLGNHALRSNWVNSFWIPPTANNVNLSPYLGVPFIEYGAVRSNPGITTDQIRWQDMGTGLRGLSSVQPEMQAADLPAEKDSGCRVLRGLKKNAPLCSLGHFPLTLQVVDPKDSAVNRGG